MKSSPWSKQAIPPATKLQPTSYDVKCVNGMLHFILTKDCNGISRRMRFEIDANELQDIIDEYSRTKAVTPRI